LLHTRQSYGVPLRSEIALREDYRGTILAIAWLLLKFPTEFVGKTALFEDGRLATAPGGGIVTVA
jgi:hypothetical protein